MRFQLDERIQVVEILYLLLLWTFSLVNRTFREMVQQTHLASLSTNPHQREWHAFAKTVRKKKQDDFYVWNEFTKIKI